MRAASAALLIGAWVCGCAAPDAVHGVSDTPAGAYEASLAVLPDRFAVAWYDTRDGHAEIYQRDVALDGRPLGVARRLTAGTVDAYEADIQPLLDGFVVGWYEKAPDKTVIPRIAAWSGDGVRRWLVTPAARGRNTVVRTQDGLVFAAWIDDRDCGVWAAWWDAAGRPVREPRRLAKAGRTTWNLSAAIDPASSPAAPSVWVVFDATAGTRADELFLARLDEEVRVFRLTEDDAVASKYPDVVRFGDRLALTWFDERDGNREVYLAAVPLQELSGAAPIAGRRVTRTPGRSIGAYVAWNSQRQRLGLAWSDDSEGQHEVYFATFDQRGDAVDDVRRITATAAHSLIPAIHPAGDRFVLGWNEYETPLAGAHAASRSRIVVTVVE